MTARIPHEAKHEPFSNILGKSRKMFSRDQAPGRDASRNVKGAVGWGMGGGGRGRGIQKQKTSISCKTKLLKYIYPALRVSSKPGPMDQVFEFLLYLRILFSYGYERLQVKLKIN